MRAMSWLKTLVGIEKDFVFKEIKHFSNSEIITTMAINLQKGQRIEIGLQKVGVGLGWDPNTSTGYDFDLDASAFMLGEDKKLPSLAGRLMWGMALQDVELFSGVFTLAHAIAT